MELIQTVFDQIRSEIQQKLDTLEKEIVYILSQNSRPAPVPEDFLKIKETMNALNNRLGKMEYRLQSLEVAKQASPHPSPIPTSAGLEGLLLRSINLPSPILSHNTIVQKSVDIVEPDEEALQGELAAQAGGLELVEEDEEEEVVEEVVEEEAEEEVEEEVVEEDEEEEEEVEEEAEEEEVEEEGAEEEVELEEWLWKGKTYYKSTDNKVYRTNEDGDIEDDPFAEYIPTPAPGRLVRI
jgi:hypothetical protein